MDVSFNVDYARSCRNEARRGGGCVSWHWGSRKSSIGLGRAIVMVALKSSWKLLSMWVMSGVARMS